MEVYSMSDDKSTLINERHKILDIVESYELPLTKIGENRYKILCPFHEDSKPSLTIFVETNSWYCYGCQEGSDICRFIMLMESISYPEAIRRLTKGEIFSDYDTMRRRLGKDKNKNEQLEKERAEAVFHLNVWLREYERESHDTLWVDQQFRELDRRLVAVSNMNELQKYVENVEQELSKRKRSVTCISQN